MIVDYSCSCKKIFNESIELKINLLLPCNHYIHEECLKKKDNCPICNIEIIEKISEEQIKKSKNKQNIIDLRSLKDNGRGINYEKCLENITIISNFEYISKIYNIFNKIINSEKLYNISVLKDIIETLNINIKIHDKTHKTPIKYKNNRSFIF